MKNEMFEKFEREYSRLSYNIKSIRKMKNITQEKLAEKSGLSISYIKQLESKKEYKNLTFESMVKLSKGLDVEIADLFQ